MKYRTRIYYTEAVSYTHLPATRKKIVKSASLTQCSNDIRKPEPPNAKPNSVCQKASKSRPSPELVRPTAKSLSLIHI